MPRHKNKIAPDWIPAAAARAHIAYLKETTSCSTASIARAANLPPSSLSPIAIGQTEVVHHTAAEAILAVTPEIVAADATWFPAEPIRRHLEMILSAEDCTHAGLISASGFDARDISELLEGTRTRVRPSTYQAMMRLTPEIVRRNTYYVSAERAKARIWALRANQWPLAILARRLGYKDGGIPFLGTNRSGTITQTVDRRVEALFNEIGDERGPSPAAGKHAAARGYYPPIHYDENMRLIPGSVPGPTYVPKLSTQERARRHLRIMGLTLREHIGAEIALTLNVSERMVERTRGLIGLRLEASTRAIFDLPYIKPGQDAMVAAIEKHTKPINLSYATEILDDPGADHVALWESLLAEVERIRYVEWWESALALIESTDQIAA